MGYRNNVSDQADINEGLAEMSQESLEREKQAADFVAALDAVDAEMQAKAIEEIVNGIVWFSGKQMSLTEWAEALDGIEATTEQRKQYEEARRDHESCCPEFMDDYDMDYDRYPEDGYSVNP